MTVSRIRSADDDPSTAISHRRAPLCRTALVTASRTTQPSSASVAGASGGPDRRTTGSMPAAVSAEDARSSSVARLPSRYPVTASRISVSACLPTDSMSVTCASAASRSRGASRRAASDLTTITDNVCPSRSCRSRENRSRSSSTARRASSSRAARNCRTASDRERIAAVTIVDRNVP